MSAKRYYSAQFCDKRKGWTDINNGCFLSKKKADEVAKNYAESKMVATRAVRKPSGWVPN